jgi:hypothetical protein
MGNILTKEAKVKVGFDIDTVTAQKGFENNAKAAEKLEKAIDKVGGRYKQVKEEFATNKSAAISGTLGAITRAATGVSDEVGRMLAGFGVVANVIQMFGALNSNIQNSVKSLKELRAAGGTLTQLQSIQYAGGAGAGIAGAAVGASARTGMSTVVGAAAGGAVVSAASQFATSQAATQVKGAIDKAVEKFGDKVSSKADNIFDSVIDSIIKKKKPGSSLATVGGGSVGAARKGNGWDGDVFDTTWRYNTPKTPLMLGRDQTIGEYVKDALANSSSSPTMGKPSAFSRFLYNAQTEFGSPKNRMNVLGGAAIGATVGSIAGYGLGGGEGAGLGGTLGAVAGGAGNLMMGGGISKAAIASLANPLGLALAGVAVTAASVLLVKGGEKGDKVADTIAGWYLSIFENGADKAQKKLNAKLAEQGRRETVAQTRISITSARDQALEGLRDQQFAVQLQSDQVRAGRAGFGFDTSLEIGGQNLNEASQRLIAARTSRFRGVDLGRGGDGAELLRREQSAYGDFQSQFDAQGQLTSAREAGQLAIIDPQISRAQLQFRADASNRDAMIAKQRRVNEGLLKSGDRGFTDSDMADAYNKAEQSARKLKELEEQRGQIKRQTLEVQKQEFAVFREQARAMEQAARAALAEKESTIDQAQKEFGMMSSDDRQYSAEIAKQIKEKGISSLTEDQKQFASGKALFSNLYTGQLAQTAVKDYGLNVGDYGLSADKEQAALKAAQGVRVEIERNMTFQLTASDEKIAAEIAQRTSGALKDITLNIEMKFGEQLRLAMDNLARKIAEQIQAAKLEG